MKPWSFPHAWQSKALSCIQAVVIMGSIVTSCLTGFWENLTCASTNFWLRAKGWNRISSSEKMGPCLERIARRSGTFKNWCLIDHNCCGVATCGAESIKNWFSVNPSKGSAHSHSGLSFIAWAEHSPMSKMDGFNKLGTSTGCDQVIVGETTSSKWVAAMASGIGSGRATLARGWHNWTLINWPTCKTCDRDKTWPDASTQRETVMAPTNFSCAFSSSPSVVPAKGDSLMGAWPSPSKMTVQNSASIPGTTSLSLDRTGQSIQGVSGSIMSWSRQIEGTGLACCCSRNKRSKMAAIVTGASNFSSHLGGCMSSQSERCSTWSQHLTSTASLSSICGSAGCGHNKLHLMVSHDM